MAKLLGPSGAIPMRGGKAQNLSSHRIIKSISFRFFLHKYLIINVKVVLENEVEAKCQIIGLSSAFYEALSRLNPIFLGSRFCGKYTRLGICGCRENGPPKAMFCPTAISSTLLLEQYQ